MIKVDCAGLILAPGKMRNLQVHILRCLRPKLLVELLVEVNRLPIPIFPWKQHLRATMSPLMTDLLRVQGLGFPKELREKATAHEGRRDGPTRDLQIEHIRFVRQEPDIHVAIHVCPIPDVLWRGLTEMGFQRTSHALVQLHIRTDDNGTAQSYTKRATMAQQLVTRPPTVIHLIALLAFCWSFTPKTLRIRLFCMYLCREHSL